MLSLSFQTSREHCKETILKSQVNEEENREDRKHTEERS